MQDIMDEAATETEQMVEDAKQNHPEIVVTPEDLLNDQPEINSDEINALGEQLEAQVDKKISPHDKEVLENADSDFSTSESSNKSLKNKGPAKSRSSKSLGKSNTQKLRVSQQKTRKYKKLLLKLTHLQTQINKALLEEEEKIKVLNNLEPDIA